MLGKLLMQLFILCFCCANAAVASASHATNLTRALLNNYEKMAPPEFPISVSYKPSVKFFSYLGDNVGQLTVWMEQTWTDPRLRWNPKDYNNISRVSLPSNSLWKPDVEVYSAVRQTEVQETLAEVLSSGKIIFIPPVRIFTNCEPGKNSGQVFMLCRFVLGSWTYCGNSVDLNFLPDKSPEFQHKSTITNWDSVQVSGKKIDKRYEGTPDSYVSLSIDVSLRRQESPIEVSRLCTLRSLGILLPFIFLTERKQSLRLLLTMVHFAAFAICCFNFQEKIGQQDFRTLSYGTILLILACFCVHLLPRYSTEAPCWLKQLCNRCQSRAAKAKSPEMQADDGEADMDGEQEQLKHQQQQLKHKATAASTSANKLIGPIADAVFFALSLLVMLVLAYRTK